MGASTAHRVLAMMAPFALIAVAAGLALMAAAPPTPDEGHESPEAVWERFERAAADADWAAVYHCLEPATGRRLLAGLALNADAHVRQTRAHDRPMLDEWADLVRRTGLRVRREQLLARPDTSDDPDAGDRHATDDALLAAVTANVADPAACFHSLMVFMQATTGRANPPLQTGPLQALSVHDDTATATITESRAGQQLDHPVRFRRIGANWFLEWPRPQTP